MTTRASGPVAALAAERGLDLAEGDSLGHAYLDICPPALQDQPGACGLPELSLRPVAGTPRARLQRAPARGGAGST